MIRLPSTLLNGCICTIEIELMISGIIQAAKPLFSGNTVLMMNAVDFSGKLLSDPYFLHFIIIFVAVLLIRVFFNRIAEAVYGHRLDESHDSSPGFQYDVEMLKSNLAVGRKVMTWLVIGVPLFYLGYVAVHGTEMQGYVLEWLNLIVRWAHVIAGIMWIGASFYFIFLENNLNRTKGVRDELAGNLWAIHGGGFYFLEKYKVAPKEIPEDLHWFKYEAYLTWITGFFLLWLVYYMEPQRFLIDSSVADITVFTAILIGVGVLIAGWFVYDIMCKSPLIKNQMMFTLVGLLLLTLISYFLVNVFSSRAAFIHMGALIGTIMAGNVFFIIIPSQKALVRAAISGEKLDATLGQKAQQRSLHNNYFTLPVVFIMISNHFPSTFGHEYNWAVLMVIMIASAGIKHYWNLIERGVRSRYILPVSVAALIALALVTSPLAERDGDVDLTVPVSFSEVQPIFQARCTSCHSANPSDPVWTSAPAGVKLDTPEEIIRQADAIMRTTIRTHFMPLGNLTNMTEEERLAVWRWISQGANIDE